MNEYKKHLVVGVGEVGEAIASLLEETELNLVTCIDKNTSKGRRIKPGRRFYAMHVCFPYSDDFKDSVKKYRNLYPSEIVIVHSTVPVGTCEELEVVHSPVSGKHPNLLEGLKTFTKCFGSSNDDMLVKAVNIFLLDGLGIDCDEYFSASITEAMKLWATTQYGWMIIIQKEIYNWCVLNFPESPDIAFYQIYEQGNSMYNRGYCELKNWKYRLPILDNMPGPIGGHCVIPNLNLFEDKTTTLVEYLKMYNDRLKNSET